MTSILPLLMLVIVFACVASCFTEGMWSNAIRLVNVITAALLATNFFEPVARWLDDWQPSYTYLWDFLALWGLFAVFMVIFRELTDRVSRVNVRFLKLADRIGSGLLSVWIGCVIVCFTMMTLHTAPLGRNFLFEGFTTKKNEPMIFGLGPDRHWLGFTRAMSTGAFSSDPVSEFNAKEDFIPKYTTRRTNLEENVKKTESLRVGP